MADDLSGWTLQSATPAAPSEVAGWALQPAQSATKPATNALGLETGGLPDAIRRGATQGTTQGYGDELTGAIGAPVVQAYRWLLNRNAVKLTPQAEAEARAAGVAAPPRQEVSLADDYRALRDADRTGNATAEAAHRPAYLASLLGGGVASSFAPGLSALNAGKGDSLGGVLLKGMGQGGIAGLGGSEADITRGDVGRAAMDTAAGGTLGALLSGVGYGAGRLADNRFARADAIRQAVLDKAQAAAASETASARSAAGAAAQDSYKQLEHLRELGALRNLTPEENATAQALSSELAAKAQEKLLPAAARKAATAEAFKEAMATEAQRAEQIAADKLSGGEAARQLKARLLRYGLPAMGGAAAGAMGFGGHGALVGAGSGALMGAGLRPMMHSLLRMAGDPSVARPLALGAGNALEYAAAPAITRGLPAASLKLSPDVAAMVLSAFRKKQEQDFSAWTPETP